MNTERLHKACLELEELGRSKEQIREKECAIIKEICTIVGEIEEAKAQVRETSLDGYFEAKKIFESLTPEEQTKYRKKAWAGYDYDNLPSMSLEQLVTFRRVPAKRQEELSQMSKIGDENVILLSRGREEIEGIKPLLGYVTCNKCKEVRMGVSIHFAVDEVNDFNRYYDGLSPEKQLERGSRSDIANYLKCGCGNPHTNFRPSLDSDCPDGCTICSILHFSQNLEEIK